MDEDVLKSVNEDGEGNEGGESWIAEQARLVLLEDGS
jgi:hypothetical protein